MSATFAYNDAEPQVTSNAAVHAINSQAEEPSLLGELMIEAGSMKQASILGVLAHQKQHGLRFGEAVVALRLASQADVDKALMRQFRLPVAESAVETAELVALHAPNAPVVDALRELRAQLLQTWLVRSDRRCLAIAGSTRQEGRSFMAANLAFMLAQSGRRVLLVDADLRNGRQHEIFGLPNLIGLSSVLAGKAPANAPQIARSCTNLRLLGTGPVMPTIHELLASSMLDRMVQRWCDQFDCVLIDTPAASDAPEALSICAAAGDALIVARDHRSLADPTSRLAERLRISGVQLQGAVLSCH